MLTRDPSTTAAGVFIDGTADADRLVGGGGDDTLRGGLGDDRLTGRDGVDVAVYDGSIDDFDLRLGHRGIWYVTDENIADGDEGRDELRDIEQIRFNDYTFNLNGDNPAVISAETTTVMATAGQAISFSISAYDVDDPIALQLFDNGGTYDKITVSQPYWAVQTIGERGRVIDATVTIDQNGSADALGYSDFSRGYLAQGETETVTLSFRAGTSTSGWTTMDIDVVWVGVNDDPTLAALPLVTVVEDGGPVTLDLAPFAEDIDSDDDGTTLTYTLLSGAGALDLSIDGAVLTVDPKRGFQHLSADEFKEFTVQIQATDRHGATTEIRDIVLRVQGSDDPLTLVSTPDGKPDYDAIGVDPFAAPNLGVLNALNDDPAYLDLFASNKRADTIVVHADSMVFFESDTFFFDSAGTTNYASFPIKTKGGNDTLLIALTGDAVEFQINEIITGKGRDIVVIDVQTPFGIEAFGNSVVAGPGDDQLMVNIDTSGVVQFASNFFGMGTGNDVVNIEIRSTRSDGPGGLAPFSNNTFNLGTGNDRLTIDIKVPNAIDAGIDGNIDAGAGNDYVEISNAGTTLSSSAFSSFRTLGLYSTVTLGDGDDTFVFDVRAFDGEGAVARIKGGGRSGDDTGFDTVVLKTGNIADFDVTRTGDTDWTIVQGGQTLYLTGIEEITALDGSISDLFV